jgi:transposase-like protein
MKARRLPQDGIVLEVLENLQEIIWDKISSGVKRLIKTFIEDLLEEELSAALSANRYERNQKRKGYRNGHYKRELLTKFGLIKNIQVPWMDKTGMEFTVFDRYERRRRDVDAALGWLFLNGVSTRKLKGIARELWGKGVSAQSVSNACKTVCIIMNLTMSSGGPSGRPTSWREPSGNSVAAPGQ